MASCPFTGAESSVDSEQTLDEDKSTTAKNGGIPNFLTFRFLFFSVFTVPVHDGVHVRACAHRSGVPWCSG